MTKFKPRAFAVLLLILALLASLACPALARETDLFSNEPMELDFKSLKPEKPDTAAFDAAAAKLETAIGKDDNADEVALLLAALFAQLQQIDTGRAVFAYHYACNSAAYAHLHSAWADAVSVVFSRYTELMLRLKDSQYADVSVQVLGPDVAAYQSSASPDTPAQVALLRRQAELVNTFWSLSSKTYSTTHNGVIYHSAEEVGEAYISDAIDYDTYLSLFTDLSRQSNAETGPIFLQIVSVLNEYAALAGFENFGSYSYENMFGRDYTMADSAVLHALVKKHIVPLRNRLDSLSLYSPAITAAGGPCQAFFTDTDQADILAMVQPYMQNVSSEYADLFDYMIRCGLVDIASSDTKNQQAFSSYLPSYNSALIFAFHEGGPYDAKNLVHEFGHFAAFCFSDTQYAGQSVDVAEINSQGLEVLYLPYADEMLSDEAAPYYRFDILNSLVGSVTMGCLVDEFLQRVYTTPGMTLDDANQLYRDLAESYGYTMADDVYRYSWTAISHNYENPFYNISYATSALAALELLSQSLTDYDAACDTYLNLTKQGGSAKDGFRGALKLVGLSDVFREDTVSAIAAALEPYLYEDICGVRFSDLTGSWAEADARFCAAAGLFSGDTQGKFLPTDTLTRAQAAALLWRMNGSAEAETTGAFSDVAQGVWYAPAADWCAQVGIVDGTSAAEAVFSADAPISRQEMAVLLYRMNQSPEAESAQLPFFDAAAVSDWAESGMSWAVGHGFFRGRENGALAPTAPLTRGEAAALVCNYILG